MADDRFHLIPSDSFLTSSEARTWTRLVSTVKQQVMKHDRWPGSVRLAFVVGLWGWPLGLVFVTYANLWSRPAIGRQLWWLEHTNRVQIGLFMIYWNSGSGSVRPTVARLAAGRSLAYKWSSRWSGCLFSKRKQFTDCYLKIFENLKLVSSIFLAEVGNSIVHVRTARSTTCSRSRLNAKFRKIENSLQQFRTIGNCVCFSSLL